MSLILICCFVFRQNEIEQTEFAGWARMGTVRLVERFVCRHGSHIGIPKQRNGGHTGAPNQSSGN